MRVFRIFSIFRVSFMIKFMCVYVSLMSILIIGFTINMFVNCLIGLNDLKYAF